MPPTVTADSGAALNSAETVCDSQPTIPFILPPPNTGLRADTLARGEFAAAALPMALTSRALTEISGGSANVPIGSQFRFGLSLKLGDAPAGSSLALKDGAGNTLTAQFDAINHWPDGSVRWCEVRGYTVRVIGTSGTDSIAIYTLGGAFSNTLPGGKTAAQLLVDLQSFAGAQDLNIELSSLASASGASNIYTTGTWTAHFNTLAVGPYVQQVNKGPCCMGYRAWGQLTNTVTGAKHAHIHVAFYVWLWLDPTTGAIRDVEYIVYPHNSLLTQSTDGTAYSTFPPDRYNYNPALKNGSTVIVNNSDPTMVLHAGAPGAIGGHHPRSGWFTARADGKPRWIAGTVEATNLHISFDPVQTNPQRFVTARDYLTSTGLLPRFDVAMTDCPIPPAPGTQSYAPMIKGVIDNSFVDWNPINPVSLDTGGNGNRIALITGDQIYHFYIQTPGSAQNNRITALGFMTFPCRFLDVNGRIPNVLGADVAGLTSHTRQSYLDCTPGTEQAGNIQASNPTLVGNWSLTNNTTHYPNLSYYTYLVEGGAHHRDCVALQSGDSVWWYQDCDYNLNVAGRSFGTNQGINRAPLVSGTVWYGNRTCSWNMDREEGWAFREVMLPSAVLPDALADGAVFGETLAFKGYLNNSCGMAAAVINTAMPAAQLAGGFQLFYGGFAGSLTVPLPGSSGSVDPWMQAYIAQAWARAFLLHGTDPALIANLTTMCNFHRKFHENFINTRCSVMSGAQTVASKFGQGGTFRAWPLIGDFINGTKFGGGANKAVFNDTVTGWITSQDDSANGPQWFAIPIDVGATLFFTRDFFGLNTDNIAPPFTYETLYRIVAIDILNSRFKVCLDADGTNAVVVPSASRGPTYICIVQMAPSTGCPTSYLDLSASPPFTRAYASAADGQDTQINGTLLALRAYRQALGDTAGSAAADAATAARILDYNAPIGSGIWSRTLFSNRPMNWVRPTIPAPIITVTPMVPQILSTTPKGTVVATVAVVMTDGRPYTGGIAFGPPSFDDSGTFSISGSSTPFSIIINPGGPGVAADGATIQNITVVAMQ